jgi:NDP-sugar pyrophosphorylase family protein
MKVVILAAGKGTRMGDLSVTTPKPILKYQGKNLIQHKLELLPESTKEIIIVIGHLGEKIIGAVGNTYILYGQPIPVTYIWQNELLGTAHSLWQAKDRLNMPFFVLNGDDLYSTDDLKQFESLSAADPKAWAVIVQTIDEPMKAGKCVVNENGHLVDIVKDFSGEIPYNKMYTGACLLTPDIFELDMVKLEGKEEFGLPQTFSKVAHVRPINVIEATYWKRITSPEDLV